MTTIEKINQVREASLSVYSGLEGRCCCGCAGKHYYRSDKAKKAGLDRGYPIRKEEINDRMVKRVSKIVFEAAVRTPHLVSVGDVYWSTVVGKRLYIVYFSRLANA